MLRRSFESEEKEPETFKINKPKNKTNRFEIYWASGEILQIRSYSGELGQIKA